MSTSEQMEMTQEALYDPRRMREKSLEKVIEKKTGIKGKVEKGDEKSVVKGVKNVLEVTRNHQAPKLKMEDAKKIGKNDMSTIETAELILRKSGKAAKLSDMKMRQIYDKEGERSPHTQEQKQETKKEKQTFNKEMQDLLNESLRKNNKVR